MIAVITDSYRPAGSQDQIVSEIGYDPEADLANTPDSVFCDHGAGFNVKWNNVRSYMHVDSGWRSDGYHPIRGLSDDFSHKEQKKKLTFFLFIQQTIQFLYNISKCSHFCISFQCVRGTVLFDTLYVPEERFQQEKQKSRRLTHDRSHENAPPEHPKTTTNPESDS